MVSIGISKAYQTILSKVFDLYGQTARRAARALTQEDDKSGGRGRKANFTIDIGAVSLRSPTRPFFCPPTPHYIEDYQDFMADCSSPYLDDVYPQEVSFKLYQDPSLAFSDGDLSLYEFYAEQHQQEHQDF